MSLVLYPFNDSTLMLNFLPYNGWVGSMTSISLISPPSISTMGVSRIGLLATQWSHGGSLSARGSGYFKRASHHEPGRNLGAAQWKKTGYSGE